MEANLHNDIDRQGDLEIIEEDRILFFAADRNGDAALDMEEFLSFSHPEGDPEMHRAVVESYLKKHDADGDGRVAFAEFLGERGKERDKKWLEMEKDRFDEELDGDKDGYLSEKEILAWMIPTNEDVRIMAREILKHFFYKSIIPFQIAQEETDHLFAGADEDVDGFIDFKEGLNHHDIFVGSEATDYGEMLHEGHKILDEL